MQEKSCGAIIFRNKKGKLQFLLVKQKSLNWGFAKGHVIRGESEEQTALREIKEETQLDVELVKGFRVSGFFYMRKTKKQVVFFLAKAKPDQKVVPQESEILEYCWEEYDGAKEKLRFTNVKKMLEDAYIHILKNE
jgi:bis(5'-nucleosidyl)-tetraphosphatase